MPRGLVFRLGVMLVAGVAASLFFRRDAAPEAPGAESEAPPRIERSAQFERDERGAGPATAAAPRAAERIGPCDVTHVTDGDTLNVRCAGRKERVRLLQIDTPEREDALYEEAGAALESRIAGRRVELELGPEERDDHGRLLAYVFVAGENLNLAMIRDGWSPYFDRYGAGAYPREFAEAEREARAAGRGIWGARD